MPEFFDFFDPTPEEQNVVLVDAATARWPNPFRNEITRRSDNPTVANRKFRIEPLNCGPARRPRPSVPESTGYPGNDFCGRRAFALQDLEIIQNQTPSAELLGL